MMALFLLLGLVLGAGIGATTMWLYLMEKYGGRRVDWDRLVSSFVMSMAIGAVIVWMFHG